MYQSHAHGAHIKTLSDRIEHATNMNSLAKAPTDSENFQVMNYGVGGSIDLHIDHAGGIQEDVEHGGGRLVTFMVYMSHVDAGGHTIFPQTGVWQKPAYGDALFWFNFDSAGLNDSRNHHFGCPVIHGNKWIANKWYALV